MRAMRWLCSMLLFVATSSYVYNSNDAPPALYRFFVDMSYCGGTLISSRYVITAAHCVDRKFLGKLFDTEMEVTTRTVERVKWSKAHYQRRHPISLHSVFKVALYNRKNPNKVDRELIISDLAVIQLAKPISVCDDEFGPLALLLPFGDNQTAENMFKVDRDHQCLQIGFGKQTKENVTDDHSKPRRMRQQQIRRVTVYKVDLGDKERVRYLKMSSNIPSTHICKGDSGSPVFCIVNDYPTLMSVVSTGYSCGRPHSHFYGTDIKQILRHLKKAFTAGGTSMWDELMEDQEKCRSYYKKNGFLTEYVNRIRKQKYPPADDLTRDAFTYPPVGSIKMDGSRRSNETGHYSTTNETYHYYQLNTDSTTSLSISLVALILSFYM